MNKNSTADVATKTAAKLPQSLLDLGKPSLHGLSYCLRHPDTWPEGFAWDYSMCTKCAMGLARQLWKEKVPDACLSNGASIMARAFAMPYEQAASIFMGKDGSNSADWMPKRVTTKVITNGHLWWKTMTIQTTTTPDLEAITPEVVADQIDKYLATVE